MRRRHGHSESTVSLAAATAAVVAMMALVETVAAGPALGVPGARSAHDVVAAAARELIAAAHTSPTLPAPLVVTASDAERDDAVSLPGEPRPVGPTWIGERLLDLPPPLV